MAAFDHLDSWFEKGFRVRQQKAAKTASAARRDAVRSRSGGPGPAQRGAVKFSSDAKAKNIKSVIRKAPEVMVKITGSSNGLQTVKHHLDYISRNGEVELVDEHGQSLHGKAQVRGLLEQIKASQIPESGNKREFLHVIFSMPAGTSDKAMREAVANFCQEEFSNRRYVMAQHDDTDHSHIHVCVGTRDIDRADEPRLSPRKADLFRWRQGFADKLREQGVDAAASERRHRFNHRKSEHAVVRQIRADNPASAAFNARRAEAKAVERAMKASARPQKAFVGPPRPARVPKVTQGLRSELKAALAAGVRPANPAHERIESNRAQALAGWEKVAATLDASGDRELAQQVREFMQAGQAAPRSRNQVLYDAAAARSGQVAGRSGDELDR
jgi:hypothetical protein